MEIDCPALDILRRGCQEVGVDIQASTELARFLLTKRLLYSHKMSPSSKLDELLHWVLLNTEVRKSLEMTCVGEICYTTQTSMLDEFSKCKRRWGNCCQNKYITLLPCCNEVRT